jgi:hypothetical protein
MSDRLILGVTHFVGPHHPRERASGPLRSAHPRLDELRTGINLHAAASVLTNSAQPQLQTNTKFA